MQNFKKTKKRLVILTLLFSSIIFMLMPIALCVFDSTETVEFLGLLNLIIVTVFIYLYVFVENLSMRQGLKISKSTEGVGK